MRVLVGCEASGTVTKAFRDRGIEAFSCDIEDTYGDLPEYHYKGDLREVYSFVKPDLFIAHPPCTYLSKVSAPNLFSSDSSIIDWVRYEKGLLARDFFLWCLSRPGLVCVENPFPLSLFGLPKYSQVIQPYYFGHPYSKATCLWLKNLNPLIPTNFVSPSCSWNILHSSSRIRSKTFEGIAAAMALQWSTTDFEGYQYRLGV